MLESERLHTTHLYALCWNMLHPIWDPHTKQKIFQLEKVQPKAVKWTTSNYDYRSSVTAMLQSIGWRILEQRRADTRLCLFYKIVYEIVAVLPVYIQQPNRLSWHCQRFLQVLILSTGYCPMECFVPACCMSTNC